jgi:sugar lactone lactonase YvrE
VRRLALSTGLSFAVSILWSCSAPATETENHGIAVLPAPGKVTIDGKTGDWDLSGGIFACGDVENQRERMAVWIHAMYDRENLYVLARWRDETPMNNPRQALAGMGFNGDCLQLRIVTHPGTPQERCSHWDAWRDCNGQDVLSAQYGKQLNEGNLGDAKAKGAKLAFLKDPDGKGYVQEMALPWALLTKDGRPQQAGEQLTMTVEPNFTIGADGRLTIKDIFKPGVSIDRVFTFMSSQVWGTATLERKGRIAPRPVRLSDAREFQVRMENGVPVVDWKGLIKQKEAAGFAPVRFAMPEDGYVSLHLRSGDGTVVRQLLNCEFRSKGPHEVKWDGLSTPIWRQPGEPVAPGVYTWQAIYHKGIGLRLRGFASNGGATPWDYPPGTGNWGGDHGVPCTAASDKEKVYLGWSGAEAGKALLACDLEGRVQWNNTHGGIGGAQMVAVDGRRVYVVRDVDPQGDKSVVLYQLDARQGSYIRWDGTESADLEVKSPDGLAAQGGSVFLSYAKANEIKVLDGRSGRELQKLQVPGPAAMCTAGEKLMYVLSHGTAVLALSPAGGPARQVVGGLKNAAGVAADAGGNIYVAVREPDNQVKVFSAEGKPLRQIGRRGGRPQLGPWVADGMSAPGGVTVDADGKLWVMEADMTPKRVSVWDAKTGKLVREFFGPTHYGASGGAILPKDPDIMVGEGCEWRIDPKTGRGRCTGIVERRLAGAARFCLIGPRVYLVTGQGMFTAADVRIYQRLGEGRYLLRASIAAAGKDKDAKTIFWADENGDGQRQPNETAALPGVLGLLGYISMDLSVGDDLSLYASKGDKEALRIKVAGFTACGAPKYDLARPEHIPARGIPSPDNKILLTGNGGGSHYDMFRAYDLGSGRLLWEYPNTFAGVHGSHDAPPPETGLIRGSLGVVGTGRLPDPVGSIWVINSNVGEWHVLSAEGFYLARLFQGDPLKVRFPDEAVPGAVMDNAPPGLGGEDFGGSMAQGTDGKIYLQAGKTGLWNLEVTGLDGVRRLPGGQVSISPADVRTAQALREQYLQARTGTRRLAVKRLSAKLAGNFDNDFPGAEMVQFQKQDNSEVRARAAWDERNLYLAWDVRDPTPWLNGAQTPEMLYLHGDTVDFQLGTDPAADKNRDKPVEGDLRLSIGNFRGTPTAVLYRPVSARKHPKVFSSGVIKEYRVDSVEVLEDVEIKVAKRGDGYVVEAAVPLGVLGLRPADKLTLRGDFGATHGDTAGRRTRLRTYWNNQHTGIVDDAVFELMLEPKNWGELEFRN